MPLSVISNPCRSSSFLAACQNDAACTRSVSVGPVSWNRIPDICAAIASTIASSSGIAYPGAVCCGPRFGEG